MRRLLTIVLAVSLAGLGCNSTGKKPPMPINNTGKSDPTPFWSDGPGSAKGIPATAPATPNESILAGLLIDSYGKPASKAVVNVSPADAGPNAKPIGIEADEQGYFLIKGLKPGINYFLSVRGEEAGRVTGGSALTAAPNTRMLIRLSETNVSSVTPPPQPNPGAVGPFAAPEKKDNKPKLDDPPTGAIPGAKDPLLDGNDQSWSPGKTPPPSRPVSPPPPAPSSNPNIASNGPRNTPPILSVPGSRVEPPPPPSSPAMTAVPANSSPIIGVSAEQQMPRLQFALHDLAGHAVEFRHLTDKRLVVLDFWSTTCMPCLRKIPELIDLQSRYSNYVEVVGVACDMTPWNQRTKDVTGIKDYYLRQAKRPINYPLYLEGEGQEGRIQNLFQVKAYPTMVVLDHSGKERWRGSDVRQLEEALRYILQRK